jgi:hypothetical protein
MNSVLLLGLHPPPVTGKKWISLSGPFVLSSVHDPDIGAVDGEAV